MYTQEVLVVLPSQWMRIFKGGRIGRREEGKGGRTVVLLYNVLINEDVLRRKVQLKLYFDMSENQCADTDTDTLAIVGVKHN
jgi:hypothetical protein